VLAAYEVIRMQEDARQLEDAASRRLWLHRRQRCLGWCRGVLVSLMRMVLPMLVVALGIMLACGLAPWMMEIRQLLHLEQRWAAVLDGVGGYGSHIRQMWTALVISLQRSG